MKLTHEEVRERATDLALGISTGAERRRIIKHVRSCKSCRKALDEMSQVTDRVLFAAPSSDTPPGFEQRVLEKFGSQRPPRVMRLRWVALATFVALLVGGLWAWLLPRMFVSEEERLAAQYVGALETLGGKALYAARLKSTSGKDVGSIFVYEGKPSWMFATVEDANVSGHFSVKLGLAGGEIRRFGGLTLEEGKGSLGVRLDITVKQIRSIQIVDASDNVVYVIRV